MTFSNAWQSLWNISEFIHFKILFFWELCVLCYDSPNCMFKHLFILLDLTEDLQKICGKWEFVCVCVSKKKWMWLVAHLRRMINQYCELIAIYKAMCRTKTFTSESSSCGNNLQKPATPLTIQLIHCKYSIYWGNYKRIEQH